MKHPLLSIFVTVWMVTSSIAVVVPADGPAGSDGTPAFKKYGDESYGRFDWINPYPTGSNLNDASWNPDGSEALLVGASGTLIRYDGLKFTPVYTGFKMDFTAVAWYPNGEYALITASGGKLLRYEGGTLSEIDTGTTVRLTDISVCPNTGTGIIVGEQKTVLIYDGTKLTTVSSGGNIILRSAAWESSGTYAFITGTTASATGVIFCYWPQNGTLKTVRSSNTDINLGAVAFSPMDELAAIISSGFNSGGGPPEGRLILWNGTDFTVLGENAGYRTFTTIGWNPDGQTIDVCSRNGLMIFSQDGELVQTYQTGSAVLNGISWKLDGNLALLVGNAGAIASFDGGSLTALKKQSASDNLLCGAWSPSGNKFIGAGVNGAVVTYDGSSWTSSNLRVKGSMRQFNGVAWEPAGEYALLVGEAGSIVKVNKDFSTDATVQSGTVQNLRAVSFEPNGNYGIIVGDSGTIRKWDGQKSTPVVSETQLTLRGVSFRSDSSYAVIVGGDVRTVTGPTGTVIQNSNIYLRYNGLRVQMRVVNDGPVYNSVSFSQTWDSPALVAADGGNMRSMETGNLWSGWRINTVANMLSACWLDVDDIHLALACGEGGTAFLVRPDYNDIRPLDTPTTLPLTSVTADKDGKKIYCLGATGTILAYAPNKPPADIELLARNVTDNALDLVWTPNSDQDFDRYEIYQALMANLSGAKLILESYNQNDDHLLVSGLTKKTTYFYQMLVYDNAQFITGSPVINVTTLQGNIPPVASSLDAPFSITDSSMSLSWSKNGDGDFNRYELHRDIQNNFKLTGATLLVSLDAPNTTGYDDTGIAQATTYYYRLRTYDDGELYNDSNQVNATTEAINVPPVASILNQPTDISDTGMKLGWSPNNDSDFDRYELHWSNETDFELTNETVLFIATNQSETSYELGGLTNNTTYYFRLRSYDIAGLSNKSNEVAGTTALPNAPPAAVLLGELTEIGESSATLSWTKNTEMDFKQYEVHASLSKAFNITGGTAVVTLVDRNQTTYSATGLQSNTTYYFKVRVKDNSNLVSNSNEVNGTTLPNRPPVAVALYWPINETENSMELEWAVSSELDFARYELHKSVEKNFTISPATLVAQFSTNSTVRYTVSGLDTNTTYYFRLRVYDFGQLFNDSGEVNATTLGPDLPPVAPVLADPDIITETTVLLEWTANRDLDFYSFTVHKGSSSNFIILESTAVANITNPQSSAYNVTAMRSNTTYYFKIEVRDLAGKTNVSNEVRVRTLAPNINPTADAGGDREITVNREISFKGIATDPDGLIIWYAWDFTTDGTFELNSSEANATYTYTEVGVFTVTLRIGDNRGGTGEAQANISVIPEVPPNQKPLIIDAGEPILAYLGDEVGFSANFTDPDGFIRKVQWDFNGDGAWDFESTGDANATYIYNDAGNYTAALKITDNGGDTVSASRAVEVVRFNNAPAARIDSPRNAQKFYVGDLVTFNGQNSFDYDGDRITYLWESLKDSKTLGKSSVVKMTMAKGEYWVRLTVSDGELSSTAEVNISVIQKPNVKPSVKIESPTNNTIVKGGMLALSGSAKDDIKVEKVEIRVDPSGQWVKATGTKFWSIEIDTKNLANGPHQIYARSYDGVDYSDETFIRVIMDVPVPKTETPKTFIPGFETGLVLLAGLSVCVMVARRKKLENQPG